MIAEIPSCVCAKIKMMNIDEFHIRKVFPYLESATMKFYYVRLMGTYGKFLKKTMKREQDKEVCFVSLKIITSIPIILK